MVPTQAVFERMLALLGADTATVGTTASPTQAQIGLISQPFTPSPSLTLADIIEADFDGYAQIVAVAAPYPQSDDPANGDSLLDVPPGAGGYRWETTGLTNLPQTIYGFFVVIHGPVLGGTQLLDAPVILSGVNQSVLVPRAGFRQQALSVQ